jgi:3,4-dihydroxy 2-butanone 4-phosphate synthase/GTP cyclohydrolase II
MQLRACELMVLNANKLILRTNIKMNIKLSSIAEAIDEIKKGRMIIVVDDADRENEGDLICAAEYATPEVINFMSKEARGLICQAIQQDVCSRIGLEMMVTTNNSLHQTPFTVSVDLIGNGCTTGISAQDRSKTIIALIDENSKPEDFAKPGHIFPLRADKDGVLRRAGHTEAAVDLARLSGCFPSGVLVEIMSEDGTMARLPELLVFAKKHDFKIISIKDLIAYRLKNETFIKKEVNVKMPTKYGDFELTAYTHTSTNETHLALVKGSWNEGDAVLTRVHSSCVTGDILASMRCDCGEQLHEAMRLINDAGCGVILYMNQEGRGIGLVNKLKAYQLQEQGRDTVEANLELGFAMDERDYGIGAQILRDLKVTKLKLLTNNPKKRIGLIGYGLEIVETIAIQSEPNLYNEAYLKTKKDKMGHLLSIL